MEDSNTVYDSLITPVYAATENLTAYIRGNYNGLIAKTQTGTTTYYLALPSIILQTLPPTELSVPATMSGNLVLHKRGNLPSGYTSNGISSTLSSNSHYSLLSTSTGIVAYSTTATSLDSTGVTTLMTALYNTYSGSNLKSDTTSASQVASFITGGTGAIVDLYNGVVRKSIGGSVITTTSSTPSVTPLVSTTSCLSAGTTLTGSTTYPGSTAFPGACNTPDIIVCTGAGTGQIWAMCNVGANTTANYNSILTNRTTLTNVDGKLFQFARNNGFDTYSATPTLGTGANVSTGVFTAPIATTWYYNGTSNYDWRVTQLSTITNTSANIWTTSPCDTNYHVPTQSEFQTAYNAFSNATYGNVANLPTILKMPFPGDRNYSDGSLAGQGSFGFYWSSSPLTSFGSNLFFNSTAVTPANYGVRAYGFSVRCLKN